MGAVWEAEGSASDRGAAHARLAWGGRTLTYTDDTQLSLALAEYLLGDDPLVEDADAWVAAMVMVHDPQRGYGRGFTSLIEAWRDGVPVAQAATRAFADGSHGNGAAMRAAPVGLRWPDDVDARRAAAMNQAIVSHAHPVGMDGSLVVAEAVAVALGVGRFDASEVVAAADACRTPAMREAVRTSMGLLGSTDLSEVATALGTSALAEASVPAALWAAATGEDLVDTIALAVGLGGDTDTIASIAGAIRGAADGRDAIPVEWMLAMEDGPRGVTHALDLAARLASNPAGQNIPTQT